MKTTNRIFSVCVIFAAIMTLSMESFAQDNVKKSLNCFISDERISFTNTTSELKDLKTNRLKSMCNVYKFSIPKSKIYYFDDIYKAFEKDHDVAYWSVRQDASSIKHEAWNLAYGEDNAYITVGALNNQNVLAMNVIDKMDSTYRYSYVLEWINDSYSKKINGAVMFLYGKIPNKKVIASSQNSQLFNKNYKIDGDTITYTINGKEYKIGIPKLDKNMAKQLENINDYEFNDNANNEDTTVGWLSKFNVLKNIYKGDESTLSYSIVARINDLCKHSGKLLSARKKLLCIDSLEEMKQKTKDKFQKGLLDEAIDYLKQ